MNLKSFIIASLIIHIVGGIFLYFYYNPIHLSPQPVERAQTTPVLNKQKQNKTTRQIKRKKRFDTLTTSPPPKSLSFPKKALIQSKKPLNQTHKASVKFQKKDKNKKILANKPYPKAPEKTQSPAPKPEIIKDVEVKPENTEDFEKIKEEPIVKTANKVPKNTEDFEKIKEEPIVKTANKVPENLEDFEVIKEEPIVKTANKVPENTEDFEKIKEVSLVKQNKKLIKKEAKNSKQNPQAIPATNDTPKFRLFYSVKQKKGNPDLSSYPEFARKKQMQGTIVVRFFVTKEGLVDKIQLLERSGHSELDNFAIRTLARYKFFPDQAGWVHHKINYKLEGEEVDFLRLRQE